MPDKALIGSAKTYKEIESPSLTTINCCCTYKNNLYWVDGIVGTSEIAYSLPLERIYEDNIGSFKTTHSCSPKKRAEADYYSECMQAYTGLIGETFLKKSLCIKKRG